MAGDSRLRHGAPQGAAQLRATEIGTVSTDVTGTSVLIGAIAPIPITSPVRRAACDRLSNQLRSFLEGNDIRFRRRRWRGERSGRRDTDGQRTGSGGHHGLTLTSHCWPIAGSMMLQGEFADF